MTETRKNGLSQDALFSLLSNPRRRFILQYLNRTEESIRLQELATEVAAWENETEPAELTDKQEKRLYVSLYQTHIPKLEEAGIVDYDGDTGEIRLTDRGTDINRYLDADASEDDDTRHWGLYYLLIALFGVVVYGLITVGGGSVGQTGVMAIGVGWVLLAALALFHYVETERGEN
jgi:DNA-binding transcriptional ArsR family regulator